MTTIPKQTVTFTRLPTVRRSRVYEEHRDLILKEANDEVEAHTIAGLSEDLNIGNIEDLISDVFEFHTPTRQNNQRFFVPKASYPPAMMNYANVIVLDNIYLTSDNFVAGKSNDPFLQILKTAYKGTVQQYDGSSSSSVTLKCCLICAEGRCVHTFHFLDEVSYWGLLSAIKAALLGQEVFFSFDCEYSISGSVGSGEAVGGKEAKAKPAQRASGSGLFSRFSSTTDGTKSGSNLAHRQRCIICGPTPTLFVEELPGGFARVFELAGASHLHGLGAKQLPLVVVKAAVATSPVSSVSTVELNTARAMAITGDFSPPLPVVLEVSLQSSAPTYHDLNGAGNPWPTSRAKLGLRNLWLGAAATVKSEDNSYLDVLHVPPPPTSTSTTTTTASFYSKQKTLLASAEETVGNASTAGYRQQIRKNVETLTSIVVEPSCDYAMPTTILIPLREQDIVYRAQAANRTVVSSESGTTSINTTVPYPYKVGRLDMEEVSMDPSAANARCAEDIVIHSLTIETSQSKQHQLAVRPIPWVHLTTMLPKPVDVLCENDVTGIEQDENLSMPRTSSNFRSLLRHSLSPKRGPVSPSPLPSPPRVGRSNVTSGENSIIVRGDMVSRYSVHSSPTAAPRSASNGAASTTSNQVVVNASFLNLTPRFASPVYCCIELRRKMRSKALKLFIKRGSSLPSLAGDISSGGDNGANMGKSQSALSSWFRNRTSHVSTSVSLGSNSPPTAYCTAYLIGFNGEKLRYCCETIFRTCDAMRTNNFFLLIDWSEFFILVPLLYLLSFENFLSFM